MVSHGGEVAKKKAMWLYPKLMGFNPSERWGHSACFSNGFIYVFGGCCGGLHFSDVLVLNLDTMAWNDFVTTGRGPGPRDSHTAVVVKQKMIVLGGTNGSKKVNDLHILDLRSREWMRPDCKGLPPSPRESHTATLVGEEKLVIFGGSGEGEGNYLNDLHVLDLKTMRWNSPEVKGDKPVPRDSHSAVAIENKIYVYGGDCGDRYYGNVDMLDMDTLTWSRLIVQGSLPGVRAGHAAVNFGAKVYVIGGVGDKKYYNDVWILDVTTCSWTLLEICGQQPQGRFSHTAIVTNSDIAIFGGCGEDERPLNELIILQLGAEHPSGRYNISMCKIFGSHCNQEKKRFTKEAENNSKTIYLTNDLRKGARKLELESKQSSPLNSDNLHQKRRRISHSKIYEVESEPEEHSLSLSQHSSPSQSDQEQTPSKKTNNSPTATQVVIPFLKQQNHIPSNFQSNNFPINQTNSRTSIRKTPEDFHFLEKHLNEPNQEQYPHIHTGRYEIHPAAEHKPLEPRHYQNMIGAEFRGKVDGAFDSGYLMTASVNGKIFRGVLFAPAPEVVYRGAILGQNCSSLRSPIPITQPNPHLNYITPNFPRHSQQLTTVHGSESNENIRQAQVSRQSSVVRSPPSFGRDPKFRSELQGVVLTLGGSGSGHGRS